MILIASFKKCLSSKFIEIVEVSIMARCSSKSDELRYINPIRSRTSNLTIYKWEIDLKKIKIVTFIETLLETISLEMDKLQIHYATRYTAKYI